MSLLSVLLVVFIVLKLVGVIAWSWWWVLAPLWIALIPFALFLFGAASMSAAFFRYKPWR